MGTKALQEIENNRSPTSANTVWMESSFVGKKPPRSIYMGYMNKTHHAEEHGAESPNKSSSPELSIQCLLKPKRIVSLYQTDTRTQQRICILLIGMGTIS